MAIALEKQFYHVITLAVTSVFTSTGFHFVSSLNRYIKLTAVSVAEEMIEFNFQPGDRSAPYEGDGGSRWVPDQKNS